MSIPNFVNFWAHMAILEVFLVEPDDAERGALKLALEVNDFFVKAFASADAMLIHLIRFPTNAGNGRCILMNEHQPGMSGLEAFAQIRLLEPSLKVVFISHKTTANAVLQAWKNGAAGFLVWPFRPDELLVLLKQVFDQGVANNLSEDPELIETLQTAYDRLTPREREVLLLVSKGCRNQVIATELAISLPTVKMHRANLMRKLALDNVAQLVSFQHQCVRFL